MPSVAAMAGCSILPYRDRNFDRPNWSYREVRRARSAKRSCYSDGHTLEPVSQNDPKFREPTRRSTLLLPLSPSLRRPRHWRPGSKQGPCLQRRSESSRDRQSRLRAWPGILRTCRDQGPRVTNSRHASRHCPYGRFRPPIRSDASSRHPRASAYSYPWPSALPPLPCPTSSDLQDFLFSLAGINQFICALLPSLFVFALCRSASTWSAPPGYASALRPPRGCALSQCGVRRHPSSALHRTQFRQQSSPE